MLIAKSKAESLDYFSLWQRYRPKEKTGSALQESRYAISLQLKQKSETSDY